MGYHVHKLFFALSQWQRIQKPRPMTLTFDL